MSSPTSRKDLALKLRPTHDRIVAKRITEESKGGILLHNPEQTNRAEVVAVGPECSVLVGETIILGKFSAVRIDGEDLLVMRESDVFAVVE